MARYGKSRQDIQDTLEHDSPFSAQAYIDSLAADLLPVFERGKARLGEVFIPLKEAYFFRGEIVEQVTSRPINIPVVVEHERPAVVGSCGKNGVCHKHPFWACYDGCPSFLAWREAPHEKALEY